MSTSSEEYDTPETRREVIAIHQRIMDAIEQQQPELAERRMRSHIGATSARARAPGSTHVPMSADEEDPA